MAVLVLSLFRPGQQGLDRAVVNKTFKGILTNPIIIGIAAGLLWSALRIPMPPIFRKLVSSVGGVATPMGLMAMGATFNFGKALERLKPTVTAAFIKLVGFCMIFLPSKDLLTFFTISSDISQNLSDSRLFRKVIIGKSGILRNFIFYQSILIQPLIKTVPSFRINISPLFYLSFILF